MEEASEREAAKKRLEEKRDFRTHVVTYLVVNSCLIGIWAITGSGYFWPVWPVLGWGIGLVLHAWSIFGQRPITDADIEREMRRRSGATP
jgi:2TM domain